MEDKSKKNQLNNKDFIGKIKPGLTVKVHQKIKDVNAKGEEKERVQIFEGIVLGVKKPKSPEGTFTVRKISGNVGVEKIFPFHSSTVIKVEILKKAKISQAKLYYLRHYNKRLKEKKITA
jgi:large subunit ribosomal protein L19